MLVHELNFHKRLDPSMFQSLHIEYIIMLRFCWLFQTEYSAV